MKSTKISDFRLNVPGRLHLRAAALSLLAAGLLVTGCSKEPFEGPDGPEGELTEITCFSESMGEVTMDTRAVSGVDESKITDLWVVQLNSGGTAALAGPQYFSGSQLTNASGKYTVKMKIKAADSRIYFIANTHNSTLYNDATTSALVEAKTLAVTNEASLAAGNTLPMAGYFSGTPTVTALKNVTLKRAVAKMTFKLAANTNYFKLTSVKVYNVPKVLHPYRDPSKLDPGTTTNNCYPATSEDFIGEFVDLTPDDKTLSSTAKEIGWCYLPENGRGTGTATDQMNKTAATALDGATGQGNYATYVVVRGIKELAYSENEVLDLSFRIYLGSDAISNYDVKRNTHYTVTATINASLNVLDVRIEVNGATLAFPFYDYTENLTGRFVYAQTNAGAGSMTWSNALLECAKTVGWRLPTMKELNIMYCLRDTWEKTSNGFSGNYYWASNSRSTSFAQNMHFSSGRLSDDNRTSTAPYVRCIRGL